MGGVGIAVVVVDVVKAGRVKELHRLGQPITRVEPETLVAEVAPGFG